VGNEKLFLTDDNYWFFLQKLKEHTATVCHLYRYSLLSNHFHLLVRIHDETTLLRHFSEIKMKPFHPLEHSLSSFVMERFSNFLNSYSKAFNKVHHRKGALFMDYLKRSCVNEDSDFTAFVWYIHKNAVHHQLTKVIGEWRSDSYRSILSESPTALLRKEVLEWFGSKNDFIKFHQQTVYPKTIDLPEV
jgi:putative transposase